MGSPAKNLRTKSVKLPKLEVWRRVVSQAGKYDVELTYSTGSPDGTELDLNIDGKTLAVTLKSTGSWYNSTTVSVGELALANPPSTT